MYLILHPFAVMGSGEGGRKEKASDMVGSNPNPYFFPKGIRL